MDPAKERCLVIKRTVCGIAEWLAAQELEGDVWVWVQAAWLAYADWMRERRAAPEAFTVFTTYLAPRMARKRFRGRTYYRMHPPCDSRVAWLFEDTETTLRWH